MTLTQYLNRIEHLRTGRADAGEIADRLRAPPEAKIVHLAHVRSASARAAQLVRVLEALAARLLADRERESAKGEGREGAFNGKALPKGKGWPKWKTAPSSVP